jgi:site-specific DNA recombinase
MRDAMVPQQTSTASRAALYLRVSTGRQAESDLSIPDQRRQLEAYCAGKGWTLGEVFVEPGNTATDDRRPSFQAMIEAALAKPAAFDVIIVHSFSRFFRDQFQFEFYVRKLAKNSVRLSKPNDWGGGASTTLWLNLPSPMHRQPSSKPSAFDI